jgi:protease-4
MTIKSPLPCRWSIGLIRKFLRNLNPIRWFRRGWLAVTNWQRRRFKNLDYILFTVPLSMPALPEQRGWLQARVFGAPPLSLWELQRIFERIAADPRPQGVILVLRGLMMSFADLQTLRGLILHLREQGKRVICYAQFYDTAQYYVASAANEIIMQPGGELMVTGLRRDVVFLKDTLAAVGLAMDVVAISPYKGAFDQLARSEFSPEGREQLEWLLDSRYEQIVDGISAGRGVNADSVRAMIDTAPHLDTDALAAGYLNAVLHEEELAAYLGTKHLVMWRDANRRLIVQPKRRGDKHVALLRVAGLMIPGESGGPPGDLPVPVPFVGEDRAGDITVVQQVRAIMKDESAAAVVLFIDSGGGAVIAAEAMTSALAELAKTRPLVVFMNGVAASGGYEIATPAQWIVAQPGTITGSIGVITAKVVTGNLREKVYVHSTEFLRGANAGIYSDSTPFDDAQREKVRTSIEHFYQQFISRVALARKMSVEAVDAISGGRVWTGAQALSNGLVDELGDVSVAVRKARELASLPDDAPVLMFEGKGKPLSPQIADAVNPAAYLNYCLENARAIANGRAQVLLPFWWRD